MLIDRTGELIFTTMSYNHKSFSELTDSQQQDVFEKIENLAGSIDQTLIEAFRDAEEFPAPSKLIPTRVEAIWRFYSTFNFIKEQHTKFLYDMRDDVSYIISFMWRITEICGHTQHSCEEEFTDTENHGMTKEEFEFFVEWVDGFYISDYGFPKLNELQCELWAKDDLVHILITIDRVMNTMHGSGHLADRFIHGGINSLNKLAFTTEP